MTTAPDRMLKWSKTHPFETRILYIAAIVGVLTGFVFSLMPEIDLWVSGLFFDPQTRFALDHALMGRVARKFFMFMFVGMSIFVLVSFFRDWWSGQRQVGATRLTWLYLIACFVIGPGMVTNTILKDNWGRARPVQVTEFSGTKQFTPALMPSDQCEKNCSFVSGESSSIFMLFFAAALAFRAWQLELALLGVLFGGLSSLVRIGQGGHFLSDTIFAGVFMALIAVGLRVVFDILEQRAED